MEHVPSPEAVPSAYTHSLNHLHTPQPQSRLGNVFILGNQLKQILLKERKRTDIDEQQVVSPTYSWKIKHFRSGWAREESLSHPKDDIWLKVSKPPSKACALWFSLQGITWAGGKTLQPVTQASLFS